jgi:RNA polymerase sigma factor (sigma-70 family)
MEISQHLTEKGQRDYLLVQSAIQGDQQAYAKLLDLYRESVYFMVMKMIKNPEDADDLTIEAFGKAFNNLHSYQPTFTFSTWLFKIASNNCIDFIRKKRIKATSIDSSFADDERGMVGIQVKSETMNPEQDMMHQQKVKMMRAVVEQLKPRYRVLVEKRYFEELSYEEIATELNLPLGTVKAQLFRARDFLANMIEKTKESI